MSWWQCPNCTSILSSKWSVVQHLLKSFSRGYCLFQRSAFASIRAQPSSYERPFSFKRSSIPTQAVVLLPPTCNSSTLTSSPITSGASLACGMALERTQSQLPEWMASASLTAKLLNPDGSTAHGSSDRERSSRRKKRRNQTASAASDSRPQGPTVAASTLPPLFAKGSGKKNKDGKNRGRNNNNNSLAEKLTPS